MSVEAGPPWRWDTAATIAIEVLELLVDAPPRSVLNLNVPALARADVRGVRWARLAAFGAVRAAIGEVEADGSLQIELRATDEQLPPDTDTALCEAGFADAHDDRRDRRVVARRAARPGRRATAGSGGAARGAALGSRLVRQPDAPQPRTRLTPFESRSPD